MKKLLLLPITLPLGMARGAIEGALKTAADALMDLADGGGADADVYVPAPAGGAPSPSSAAATAPTSPAAPADAATPADEALEDLEQLVAELEDEAAEHTDGDVLDLPVTPEPGTPAAAAAAREVAEDLGLQEGHTDEEPDELIESEGSGSPSAELHVDEPWPGYGQMKAPDVVDRLAGADAATKAIVRLYEQQHRNRRTVIAATES